MMVHSTIKVDFRYWRWAETTFFSACRMDDQLSILVSLSIFGGAYYPSLLTVPILYTLEKKEREVSLAREFISCERKAVIVENECLDYLSQMAVDFPNRIYLHTLSIADKDLSPHSSRNPIKVLQLSLTNSIAHYLPIRIPLTHPCFLLLRSSSAPRTLF